MMLEWGKDIRGGGSFLGAVLRGARKETQSHTQLPCPLSHKLSSLSRIGIW